MHATLNSRANVALIAVSALVAVFALFFTVPIPAGPALVGALCGCVVGILQSRSLGAARIAFTKAQTAIDVRRALTSTAPGLRAIQIQWVGALVVLGTALWVRNPIGGSVAGYALLMCAREVVSLRAVGRLAHGESAVEQ